MDAVFTFFRFATPIMFGVGTVITLVALRRAPMGREDEDGFHFLESSHTAESPPPGKSADSTQSGVRLA